MKHFKLLTILIFTLFLSACTNVDNLSKANEIPDFTSGESPLVVENPDNELIIDSFSFGYSMEEIRVKQGETIKITLTNSKGVHDFVVDELNIKSEVIKAGENTTFEFTADELGEFEFYCSIGSHRANGMVGKLIIEP
jgi:plastocyanin